MVLSSEMMRLRATRFITSTVKESEWES